MAINAEKTRNMLLFFVNKMENITSIKLQKAMLFADRIHWAMYGFSISGLEYVKDEYGPVMEKAGWDILSSMDNTDLNVIYSYTRDCVKTIRTSTLKPTLDVFSDTEIKALNRSYDIVNTKTTKQLSEMTHDKAWENAKFGEILPYSSCIRDEIAEKALILTGEDEQVLQEALKTSDYSKLENLANTWI